MVVLCLVHFWHHDDDDDDYDDDDDDDDYDDDDDDDDDADVSTVRNSSLHTRVKPRTEMSCIQIIPQVTWCSVCRNGAEPPPNLISTNTTFLRIAQRYAV